MLTVSDIVKKTKNHDRLQNISFTLIPGTVTALLGPNGSGKSTLMRIILGLEQQTNGTVQICGSPYNKLERPLTIVGSCLSHEWFHPKRSIYAHLHYTAVTNNIARERANDVLVSTGLNLVAHQKIQKF